MPTTQALCTDADAFSVSGSSPPPALTKDVVEHDPSLAQLRFPLGFALERGRTLPTAKLNYRLVGPTGAPVVVALGGISADRHVCDLDAEARLGWWSGLCGPGRAVDTNRVRVLSFDYLGRGEASVDNPADLVSITTGDQARALVSILDALGIESIATFVGASYGAMVGLRFARDFGHRIGHLVAISGTHRPHPLATAWRSVQRNIVRLGVANDAADEGLALARALAMTTYRSSAEFAQRFAGEPTDVAGRVQFPVERYLEQRGDDFRRRFGPAEYLVLSESIDLHAVDPTQIHCPTTVVGVSSDALVPAADSRDLAQRLAGPAEFIEIESLFGHDAFLKEIDTLSTIVHRSVFASSGGAA